VIPEHDLFAVIGEFDCGGVDMAKEEEEEAGDGE